MSKKTKFERNFETAMINHQNAEKKALTILEGINIFFDGITKQPVLLQNYEPVKGRKNAIVLLGQSCTGKSTYAREFIKTHPEFEYLSLDECAARELMATNVIKIFGENILNNELGFKEFGKALEMGKNLLIDGGWLHINSRSALLKTLRELGYTTCAFSFMNITQKAYMERVIQRAAQNTAQEMLKGAITIEPVDWVQKYADTNSVSRERAMTRIKNTALFAQKHREEIAALQEEFVSSALKFQVETGFLYVSFDSVYMVNLNAS